MDTKTISLKDSNYFSSLMLNYIDEKEDLKQFYNRFPSFENYIIQAQDKLETYQHRTILVQQLDQQLKDLSLSKKQKKNLELLSQNNTVTITTGHQLNLFTGPIFFFYKILQVIKQCKELNKKQDKINFVPVFWMATEDHDFEEINHFHYKDRIIHWNKEHGGPVGQLLTEGLDEVFNSYLSLIPNGKKKEQIKQIIEASYLTSTTLTEATRKLVQTLFGDLGLIMIDGDDKILKQTMIPVFEKEIIENLAFQHVIPQIEKLAKLDVHAQVNPREINLFYIANPLSRERIVFENGKFHVLNTSISFTKAEILEELNTYPEKFSPNVIIRPLYQETILPNVAYIGGGGELVYWLELKTMFDAYEVDFPLLVLRNSMLIRTNKQVEKQLALNLKDEDLFRSGRNIIKENVEQNSKLIEELPDLKNQLEDLFKKLENLSTKTDVSFANMVQAQRTKQIKGFEKLEKRLVKAEIKKQEEYQNRIDLLLEDLTQNNGLQERVRHFSDFDYVDIKLFIESIYQNIKPFEFNFIINTLAEDI
ncbi:bacillithiol biosynthesis cysteine-adding enzyme BshC [Faecalibacter bovis]|uniref:Putative cysteine ligase BshC n=1 Tax=Faecalibacter bovis TaxID=2898187 RepID=A0ABX7XG51_9FLAO|nr:bacillithiol biosynthesis cysteine-adding enzyme BshC [Faecalibacter bovis]QTV06946.1 bacillithiol biosynthesis cysteine-adding enzyme BshC [Faecalibacter bovis]